MLQLNGFHPDFLSIKHHCQTLLFRRRKKNPRAASFVRTWQGWLEICTWVSKKHVVWIELNIWKKQSTLYIYILYAYISVSYVYTGSRAGSYVHIYTWIFQVCKNCAFLPKKHTKRQKFYISGRSRYIYMIDILIYLDNFEDWSFTAIPVDPFSNPVTHGVSKLVPQILPELSIRIH